MNDTSTMPDADKWLDRVTALLAQAESTPFPDEAETFMAKAQALMTAHSIDAAMIASRTGNAPEGVEKDTITITAPYAIPKTALLSVIAKSNDVRAIRVDSGANPTVVLMGFPSNVEATKAMYAALSIYAAREATKAIVPVHDTPKRFRRAFLLGFANRIGERLNEARRASEAEAQTEARPGESVGLVLAARKDQVDKAFRNEFPNVRQTRATVSSRAGMGAGRAAGSRASLNRGVGGGGQRAIG